MSESFPKKEKLKEQTVRQGNIHEPLFYWRKSLEAAKANPITSVFGDKRSYKNWKAAFMA